MPFERHTPAGDSTDESNDYRCASTRREWLALGAGAVGTATLGPGALADAARAADTDPGDPSPDGSIIGGGSLYEDKVTRSQADYVVYDAADLDSALSDASSGDVIWIDGDSTVDLGDWGQRTIPAGVTLASDRGQGGSRGGKILMERNTYAGDGVLAAETGVRIAGVQFEGKTTAYDVNPYADNDSVWDEAVTAVAIVGDDVEIANCEFWAFTNAGVRVGNINDDVRARDAHVHHCSFHDNAMESLGYGVVVGWADPPAVIEYCYFDANRHSIAGQGTADCNYIARYNHQGPNAYAFCFEMHDGGDPGHAGGYIAYHHNTFEHTDYSSIKIRGVPEQVCDVYNNWFYDTDRPPETTSGEPGDAIDQWEVSEWTNVDWIDRNNQFGSSEPAGTVGRPRDTLVFNGDVEAKNTSEDSNAERSGLRFDLLNESGYDLNVQNITIDPLNASIDELRDHSYDEGKWTSEVYIDADYQDGLCDINDGTALPATIDLDADGHSDSASNNAILSAGSKAYVHLYQFKGGGSPIDLVDEEIEFTVDYYLDSGTSGSTTFTVWPQGH